MTAPQYNSGGTDGGGFKTRFPEFQSPSEPSASDQTWINTRLTEVYNRLDAGFWKTQRSEAALLQVAHRWALVLRGDVAGQTTGKSAGSWSKSYAAGARSSGPDSWWKKTDYGGEYVTLRRGRMGLMSRVSR